MSFPSDSAPRFLQDNWTALARAERVARTERSAKAEGLAYSYFKEATAPQLAAYRATMECAGAIMGSPAWERIRTAAKAKYKATTQQANALYDVTLDEILRDGEVSEATSYSWDALTAGALDRTLRIVAREMVDA